MLRNARVSSCPKKTPKKVAIPVPTEALPRVFSAVARRDRDAVEILSSSLLGEPQPVQTGESVAVSADKTVSNATAMQEPRVCHHRAMSLTWVRQRPSVVRMRPVAGSTTQLARATAVSLQATPHTSARERGRSQGRPSE